MRRKIIVVDYNLEWVEVFNQLKMVYLEKLKGLNVDIQHVGSTSVVGLAAKPIIDIDIIVENEVDVQLVIERLTELGYVHQGNLGIEGREAFKRQNENVPYHNSDTPWYAHHLYVCIRGCVSLENHLKLRDHLRENPESVKEYGILKKRLAKKHPHDIDSYIEEKTAFITNILSQAKMNSDDLDAITNQNKKKL